MKTNWMAFLLGLAALTMVPALADENEAAKKDLALLQGEWSMVSGSADGQPMPEPMLKQMKRVCKGAETTTTMAGQMFFKAGFSIDPSKTPKTIDYQMSDSFDPRSTLYRPGTRSLHLIDLRYQPDIKVEDMKTP